MTPPLRLVSILAALGGVLAQSEADNDRAKSSSKVWAAVAFVNHGEITPALGYSPSLLTPQGAQQMHRQGAAFRQRYLTTPDSASNSSTSSPMQNIERDAIDNRAINVLSKSETWASSCALAFLQGLYPPNTKAFANYVGGEALAEDYPANGTFSYPLDGYQYPGIKTPSEADSVSVRYVAKSTIEPIYSVWTWLGQLTEQIVQLPRRSGLPQLERCVWENRGQ